jgi:hypothetical protein
MLGIKTAYLFLPPTTHVCHLVYELFPVFQSYRSYLVIYISIVSFGLWVGGAAKCVVASGPDIPEAACSYVSINLK